MRRIILGGMVGFLAGGILAIAGQMDYEDAVAQDREYTMMVCEGLWPAYRGPVTCK